MHLAAILSTGDELVQGRTVDTNSSYLADLLLAEGFEVDCVLTVGDDPERLEWAWNTALDRVDLVISTGGLGPTADDLTNQMVAQVAQAPLVRDEVQAERIRALFAARGREMPENNLRQADLPAGAVVVPNELGTAPGYRLEIERQGKVRTALVLPGVPREMKSMFEGAVLPWLRAGLKDSGEARTVTEARTFQTFGLPESELDQRLADLELPKAARLSFRASFPKVSVRIMVQSESSASSEADSAAVLADRLAEGIHARLGDAIYAEGDVGMEEVVGQLLRERISEGRRLTLASAESCTGGLIGSRLTDVAGSSEYYLGGLVAYSNDLKQRGLGVREDSLGRFGAVSEEVAREMALGACQATGADLGIATTGIAGPGGGSASKPVGTVVVALAARKDAGDSLTDGPTDSTTDGEPSVGEFVASQFSVRSRVYQLGGTREWIKVLTAQIALDWVRRQLLGLDPCESAAGPVLRTKAG